jgi:hypothetical protein
MQPQRQTAADAPLAKATTGRTIHASVILRGFIARSPVPVVAAAELPQLRESFNFTTLKTESCQFGFPSAVLRK